MFGFWDCFPAVKTYYLSDVPAKKMPGEGKRLTLNRPTGWVREGWMASEHSYG